MQRFIRLADCDKAKDYQGEVTDAPELI